MKLNMKKMMLLSGMFIMTGQNQSNAGVCSFDKVTLLLTTLMTGVVGGNIAWQTIKPIIVKNEIKLVDINNEINQYEKYVNNLKEDYENNIENKVHIIYKDVNDFNNTNAKEFLRNLIMTIKEISLAYKETREKIDKLRKNKELFNDFKKQIERFDNIKNEYNKYVLKLNDCKEKLEQKINSKK